jgi:hypothetical protein
MADRFASSAFGFPSDFGPRISDFRAAGFALSLTSLTFEQPCPKQGIVFFALIRLD